MELEDELMIVAPANGFVHHDAGRVQLQQENRIAESAGIHLRYLRYLITACQGCGERHLNIFGDREFRIHR